LAVYHERRTKDYAKALKYARKGLQALRDKNENRAGIYGISSVVEQRRLDRLRKRIARIESRMKIAGDRKSLPLLERVRRTAIGS